MECSDVVVLSVGDGIQRYSLYFTNLHGSVEHLVQNVRSALHDLAVVLCGVCVLSVGDGVHESIQVLVVLSQKIGLHELHHAVVCGQSKKKA